MDFISIRIITDDVARLAGFYERATRVQANWSGEDFAGLKLRTPASPANSPPATPAGGIMIGDMDDVTTLASPTAPSPGPARSNLQLLSDPAGVDFKPYLVQVLAAALVSENKAYAFPAGVDSIPTSANREVIEVVLEAIKAGQHVVPLPSGRPRLDVGALGPQGHPPVDGR